MPSYKSNLVIEQGATFVEIVNINDANGNPLIVAGLSSNAAMRRDYWSTNVVVFTTALSNGILTMSMSANQTGNLYPGRYVYDSVLQDISGNIIRIVEGVVTVTPGITNQ